MAEPKLDLEKMIRDRCKELNLPVMDEVIELAAEEAQGKLQAAAKQAVASVTTPGKLTGYYKTVVDTRSRPAPPAAGRG